MTVPGAAAFAQEEGGAHGRGGPMGPMGHGAAGSRPAFHEQGGQGPVFWQEADTDADGALSKAEWQAAMDKAFAKGDSDGDGKLSKPEAGMAFRSFAPAGAPHGPGMMPGGMPFGMPGMTPGGPHGGGMGMQLLEAIKASDVNGDGKLTSEEAPPFIKERFANLDANGDGFIAKDDVEALKQKMGGANVGEAMMQMMDKNGDGKVSREEAPGPIKERFDQIDANADGFVDAVEIKSIHQKWAQTMGAAKGAAKGAGHDAGAKGARSGGSAKGEKALSKMDRDGDGMISKAEAKGRVADDFQKIDANADGFVDKQELVASKKSSGGKQGRKDGGRSAASRPAERR